MAVFMKESGKMIKLMEMENTHSKTGQYMKASLLMTFRKAREKKLGLMVVNTQARS